MTTLNEFPLTYAMPGRRIAASSADNEAAVLTRYVIKRRFSAEPSGLTFLLRLVAVLQLVVVDHAAVADEG